MPNRLALTALGLSSLLAAQAPCHDLALLDQAAQQSIAALSLNGLVLRIEPGNQPPVERAYGALPQQFAMRLASGSKPLAIAVALALCDHGLLSLDQPVSTWLPEFGQGPLAAITLRMCLAHTSGLYPFDPVTSDPTLTLRQAATRIASLPLLFAPGTQFAYGNVSIHVAAAACEVVTGLAWNDLFLQRIGTPLGMTSTTWLPTGPNPNPSVADGVYGNAADYCRFLAMLRNGGVHQGQPILSQSAVQTMLTDHIQGRVRLTDPHPSGATLGLGFWWERTDAAGRPTLVCAPGAFGSFCWWDLEHDTVGVWLSVTFYAAAYQHVGRLWDALAEVYAPVGVDCRGGASPACAAPPRLSAARWMRDGAADFGLRVRNAPASAFGGVSLALGAPGPGVPLLDLTSYVPNPAAFSPLFTDASGHGQLALPLPTGLVGLQLAAQGFWWQVGGCGASGMVASRALRCEVQP
jgi:CubicO group peptidase (beta-lactamase class C family)